jgi:hypothetical protein
MLRLIMGPLGCHVSSNSCSYDTDEPQDRLMHDSIACKNPDIACVFASGKQGAFDTSDARDIIAIGASVPRL